MVGMLSMRYGQQSAFCTAFHSQSYKLFFIESFCQVDTNIKEAYKTQREKYKSKWQNSVSQGFVWFLN